ncbi:BFD-like [2Fe-2S] binding domain protein [Mycobacterium kansasii 732]|uniref:Bacterioferritin-associated ferredoxin n=1 Tax=Mycobacterium kansasii 662 TaxID=1299326 RepID=X7ZDG1_MYCKA|nr:MULTISPECIES: (2Fe-2S)-binding protein [Mycobacterium]EUA07558.1 BFD-like [2Fe-2S] binding domain protein [Mycobacterium kansasii 732]EUA17592.1 BFD-like [2Fe-2S] binding domain protein [Mycobacterium kansasii 662]MBY0388285.1 (2Fe-2S)-binding protein [Mycobacterium pseudokansasii]ORC11003.1 (2Fe-2S)-binding protein [Mycobacterium kansasii]POX91833.1 (2Fe-2S)-binding protein [Mycobacterium kansasii]
MYVCLCNGVTSQTVAEAVADGASTTKDVAQACGAGADCGRCRRTIHAILGARRGGAAAERTSHRD